MAIYKAKPANPFTQIPNTTLQDISLSFEAKGLLVLILSLPEDWEIHKTWLRAQSPKCGRDKLDKSLKELQVLGYMRKEVKRGEGGKLEGYDWFVYPEKQLEATETVASTGTLKNRIPVKPVNGESPTTNKHINKQTNSSSKPADAVFDFDLVLVWIINQMTNVQQLTEADKIFIEGSLYDYCDSAEKPRRAQAFSWVEIALQNRLRTLQRTAKTSAARDEQNESQKNLIKAQTDVVNQHTRTMKMKTGNHRNDTSWAVGLDD